MDSAKCPARGEWASLKAEVAKNFVEGFNEGWQSFWFPFVCVGKFVGANVVYWVKFFSK